MKSKKLKKKDIGWIFVFLGVVFGISGYINLGISFLFGMLGVIIILSK